MVRLSRNEVTLVRECTTLILFNKIAKGLKIIINHKRYFPKSGCCVTDTKRRSGWQVREDKWWSALAELQLLLAIWKDLSGDKLQAAQSIYLPDIYYTYSRSRSSSDITQKKEIQALQQRQNNCIPNNFNIVSPKRVILKEI